MIHNAVPFAKEGKHPDILRISKKDALAVVQLLNQVPQYINVLVEARPKWTYELLLKKPSLAKCVDLNILAKQMDILNPVELYKQYDGVAFQQLSEIMIGIDSTNSSTEAIQWQTQLWMYVTKNNNIPKNIDLNIIEQELQAWSLVAQPINSLLERFEQKAAIAANTKNTILALKSPHLNKIPLSMWRKLSATKNFILFEQSIRSTDFMFDVLREKSNAHKNLHQWSTVLTATQFMDVIANHPIAIFVMCHFLEQNKHWYKHDDLYNAFIAQLSQIQPILTIAIDNIAAYRLFETTWSQMNQHIQPLDISYEIVNNSV